jgi:hypothetical protein
MGFDEDFVSVVPPESSINCRPEGAQIGSRIREGRRWLTVPTWTSGVLTDGIGNSPQSCKANSTIVPDNRAWPLQPHNLQLSIDGHTSIGRRIITVGKHFV